MKKRITIIIAVIALSLVGILIFAGCSKEVDRFDLVKAKISHEQHDLYAGAGENFSASIVIGKKEKTFLADGKVGEMGEYCSITLTPKKVDLYDKQFVYKVVGESGEATGSLVKNLLGASFGGEITEYAKLGAIKSISVTCDNLTEEIPLTNKMLGCITYDKALEYAYNSIKDTLTDEDFADNTFSKEVYIKFINDRTNPDSEYYWYVSMIKDNENFCAILIDPKTGAIISQRK